MAAGVEVEAPVPDVTPVAPLPPPITPVPPPDEVSEDDGDEEENDGEDVENVYEDVVEVDSKDEDVVRIEDELRNCDELKVMTVEFEKVGALLELEITGGLLAKDP